MANFFDVLNAPDGTVAILRDPDRVRIHGRDDVTCGVIRATVRGEPTLYITPELVAWYLEDKDLDDATQFRLLPADGRPVPAVSDAAAIRSLLPSMPSGSVLVTEHPNFRGDTTFTAWVRNHEVWLAMNEPYGVRYLSIIWGDGDYDPNADDLAERLIACSDVTILPEIVDLPALTNLKAAA